MKSLLCIGGAATKMFMTVTVRTMMGEEWDFLVSNSTSLIDLKLSIFTKLNRMHPDTLVSTLEIP